MSSRNFKLEVCPSQGKFMNRYSTDHRNQVHQFFVSPSKHLYRTSIDHTITYQSKPIESSLNTVAAHKKDLLVHYVIADHFSAVLYGESYSSRRLPDPFEFLMRAWRQKEHTVFCGMPAAMTLPKGVEVYWPALRKQLEAQEILLIEPTSGFHAGIHHVKKWDREMRMCASPSSRPGVSQNLDLANRDCQSSVNYSAKERGFDSITAWVSASPPLIFEAQ
jgi:hypothetical protein